jgi:hypothetical protein
VLADGGEDEDAIAAEVHLGRVVVEARRMIPALRHDRVFKVETAGER